MLLVGAGVLMLGTAFGSGVAVGMAVDGDSDVPRDAGCGDTEAAELMAWHFGQEDTPTRDERIEAAGRILDCE